MGSRGYHHSEQTVTLSTIHAKGLLTLCFLLLAESVSLTNAVTFWSTYQTWSHEQRARQGSFQEEGFSRASKHAEECSGTSALPRSPDNTCAPNLPPAKLHYRSRLAKRVNTMPKTPEECCTECSNCDEAVMKTCRIPRGGHGINHAATEKVADTVLQAASSVPAPYGLPLNVWKVIFQAFLTALNVIFWLIPLRSKKMSENKLALSLANAFSGGVFLTLAFGHLIPECIHGFHDYNEVTPFMLVLAGYLLIFFVEKVAFDAHEILHAVEHDDAGPGPSHNGHHAAPAPVSGRSAVILLGALAVHSILEMMALGLADSFGDCAILTLSISLHQPAESIALLVAFLKSGMPKGDIIRFLSVFSCMGPIGVAIGMAVNEFASPIVDSIMLAIVAGTFVYVGATEVIPEEFEDPSNKWKKFAALMSGIVSIFFITQYTMTLEMN